MKIALAQPISSTSSIKGCPFYPQKHSHLGSSKFSRHSFFNRFRCSSTLDNLDGLIDPSVESDRFMQDTSVAESVSAEEYTFLRDSLLSSGAASSSSTGVTYSGKFLEDAILISNEIRNNHDGFGVETVKFLRQFREKLDESLVVQVLKLIQNPHLGVKFFLWAGRQIGYSHTGSVYNALLEMLGCDNSNSVPDNFLKEIKNDDKEVLRKLLNFVIRRCCQNGLWNMALEELGRLKDFGYKPSRVTYNALIQLFLKADKLETASIIYREMSDLEFSMDGYTLGCFVYSLCKSGRWREALFLIEKEEFVPDTIIYTKMISGLCEASLFEEAMDLLTKMRSNSCIPNVVTYRILLCGCLRKQKPGRCKRILSMMITEGCFPSSKIFNSLVHAYCRSGDYSYAYKLLRKMANCGIQPGYVVYNILIGGICGNEEQPTSEVLLLAEKAYEEMIHAGYVLNKINVSNFTRCLCGASKFEKAFNVIREMMGKGFKPDASTYSKVIGFLCNASKADKAFLLFNEMKRNGIVPDVFTYTILIDSFCKAGLIQQAQTWFDEMLKDGCAPNTVTYTALIHAYLKLRNITKANELFEMMLSAGCFPNIVTYTALIDGYCKAGLIEKACKIYSKMRGHTEISDVDIYFRVYDDEENREPNVFTYGALVDGLCKAHKVKEAHELLDKMSEENCEPNHVVYDALVDGFCKMGNFDEAQKIFAKMIERGYNPNVYTYGSLINRLFKDKRLDLVLKVLSRMLDNSCSPNVVIYTELVDGLCKVGKTDEAYKLMMMMAEKGCSPNVVTYTAMIDGFGKLGKIKNALELFRQMVANGCSPNFVTYGVLIHYCCVAGLLDEAHNLLAEMKQMHWPRHMSSYRKVIEGFNRDFIVSLGILDDLSENDSTPIIPVYRIVIDNFCKTGRLEVALDLYREISSSLFFSDANKNMYTSLIKSLSIGFKVDKAFELYSDMIRIGFVPDIGVFFDLIKGLIRINQWEEALQLSDSICNMGIRWVPESETSHRT